MCLMPVLEVYTVSLTYWYLLLWLLHFSPSIQELEERRVEERETEFSGGNGGRGIHTLDILAN